jgi:hypothetical protein
MRASPVGQPPIVNATTAEQAGVGGVHDRVDVLLRDVALDGLDDHRHGSATFLVRSD